MLLMFGEREGQTALDNGWYLFRHMAKQGPDDCLFATSPENVQALRSLSPELSDLIIDQTQAKSLASRADLVFFTNSAGDLFGSDFRKIVRNRGFKTIYLTHGALTWSPGVYQRTHRYFDYTICDSEQGAEIASRSWDHPLSSFRPLGLTRLSGGDDRVDSTGLPQRPYILFLPTWCKSSDPAEQRTFQELSATLVDSVLEHDELRDYDLVCHHHFRSNKRIDRELERLYQNPERNDGLPITRTLIRGASGILTDFSSIMFDAHYLGKPLFLDHRRIRQWFSERSAMISDFDLRQIATVCLPSDDLDGKLSQFATTLNSAPSVDGGQRRAWAEESAERVASMSEHFKDRRVALIPLRSSAGSAVAEIATFGRTDAMSKPTVSIVIPVPWAFPTEFADSLKSAVDAAEAVEGEILLVCNGPSVDRDKSSGEFDRILCSALNLSASVVRIFAIDQASTGAARNVGLAAAKSDRIVFLDSDDLLYREDFVALVRHGLSREFDVVVALAESFSKTKRWINFSYWQWQFAPQHMDLGRLCGALDPSACGKLYSARFLRDNQIWFGSGFWEDEEFSARFFLAFPTIHVSDLMPYGYRARPGARTTNASFEKFNDALSVARRVLADVPTTSESNVFRRSKIHLYAIRLRALRSRRIRNGDGCQEIDKLLEEFFNEVAAARAESLMNFVRGGSGGTELDELDHLFKQRLSRSLGSGKESGRDYLAVLRRLFLRIWGSESVLRKLGFRVVSARAKLS